jgi:5-carboxymethyl-2-hydroxymuconate isomerase
MPQITLEYSANITDIDQQSILKSIHCALSDITDIKTCKSRVRVLKNFLVGTREDKSAIVHLKVELLDLPQRTPELRKLLAEKLLKILDANFGERINTLGLTCKPTVHVAKLKVYGISSGVFGHTQKEQSHCEAQTRMQARL